MDKVRVGFIGAGNVTDMHYLGYENNPLAELYAICDVDKNLLERRMSQWPVNKSYSDYRELLADPKVDAVEIITPHHLHAEIGIASLIAGKHVSMQKPMAVTVSECDNLIVAARKSGKIFRNFENFRHYPPIIKAKELWDTGAIGDPISIRMKVVLGSSGKDWEIPYRRWEWRFDPTRGGGGRVMFDYGSHLFAIAMLFLGDVDKVYAWINHTPIEYDWVLDCPAVVMWQYKEGGHYGTLEAVASDNILVPTQYGRPEDEWIELTGTKGFIWINRCSSQLLDRPPLVMYRDGITTEFSEIDSDWGTSFVNGVNDFIAGIKNSYDVHLTPEEGKKVVQLCQAVERSAATGQEVRPDTIT